MIRSIQIKNFKSVVDLSLELGNLNVLIGENGCGKSNILEAIEFGAAASADKLDFEFLGSRGVRITNPEFMYSAFKDGKEKKRIEITITSEDKEYEYLLTHDIKNPKKWVNEFRFGDKSYRDKLSSILFKLNKIEQEKELNKIHENDEETILVLKNLARVIEDVTAKNNRVENDQIGFFNFIFSKYLDYKYHDQRVSDYVIFSPEQSTLRRFEETIQIYPLGIKGEGLFQHIKELSKDKTKKEILDEIKQNLILLDWYEDFDLPEDLMKSEFNLRIKDKYLSPSLQYFDQRSTNEGFLYLLFYSTLFISKSTPTFFAIDNIDASLNPKLCMKLTRNIASLAKKHKKQVIITTQNPAILDGLNLKDDNQRLFVVRRNEEGHTKAKRIEYKSERKLKLSEVWTSGFIGGLPENF